MSLRPFTLSHRSDGPRRQGRIPRAFTLVELLIAMTILLILATITIRVVSSTLNADRIRTGSRELQSFLAGARDRAIYAGQPRGVRFVADQVDHSTVRSFIYIGAPSNYTDGSLIDVASNGTINFESPNTLSTWQGLWARGLLTNGAQIQLSQGPNILNFYLTVSPTTVGPPPTGFTITGVPGSSVFPVTAVTYQIQLAAAPLSGEQPRALPPGIVVDLDNSVLPSTWGQPGSYNIDQLDLLFAPGGTVVGPAAASGRVHFVLSEYTDASVPIPTTGSVTGVPLLDANHNTWQATTAYVVEQWVIPSPANGLAFRCTAAGTTGAAQPTQFSTITPGQTVTDGGVTWQCFAPKSRLIVSLATATARVTTSPVDPNDKFRLAEIGEVTQ